MRQQVPGQGMGFSDTTAVELWFPSEFFESLEVRGGVFSFGIDRARFLPLLKSGGAASSMRLEYSDAKKITLTFQRNSGELTVEAVYFQVEDFVWTFNEHEYKNVLRLSAAEFALTVHTLQTCVLVRVGLTGRLWGFLQIFRGTVRSGNDCGHICVPCGRRFRGEWAVAVFWT